MDMGQLGAHDSDEDAEDKSLNPEALESSAVKLGDMKSMVNTVRAATTAVRLSKRGSIRQTQAFGFDLFADVQKDRL